MFEVNNEVIEKIFSNLYNAKAAKAREERMALRRELEFVDRELDAYYNGISDTIKMVQAMEAEEKERAAVSVVAD